MIKYDRPKSFKSLYTHLQDPAHRDRFRRGPTIDTDDLFRKAFEEGKMEFCDFLMSSKSFGGHFPWNYPFDAMRKLADRYPKQIYSHLLPRRIILKWESAENASEMIDFIEYCKGKCKKVAQDPEYEPTKLLWAVLQHHTLADDEMAGLIKRLFVKGAKLDRTTRSGFASPDDTYYGAPVIVDSEVEFKALYPGHIKSYQLIVEHLANNA
jgi:hypothetical protein